MRIFASRIFFVDRGRLLRIHQFLPSREMDVAVVAIMLDTPAITNGAAWLISMGTGKKP